MSAAAGVVILAGRILFAVYFGWVAGRAHIRMSPMFEGAARSAGFPVPAVAGWPSGVLLVVAALSVGLGIWPDVGALIVAGWVVVAAAYFHRYWELKDEQQKMLQSQLFWRNALALAAALLMFGSFAAFGPELRFTITAPLFQF
jgi:putative oxidoreductase